MKGDNTAPLPGASGSDLPEGRASDYLPNFCSMQMAISVIVGAQLLATVLALYRASSPPSVMDGLSRTTLLTLWVALLSLLLLCLLRRLWRSTSPMQLGVLAWLVIQAVTLGVCFAGGQWLGTLMPDLREPWFYGKSLGISAIVGAITLRYLYMQQRWRMQVEAEAEARLQAMQARIRPHFLFNSMNTLAELTRSDPERAEQVTMDLADLYRACLTESGSENTLGDELELVQGYLRIERLRLGDRLQVDWRMEGVERDSKMPALILQPLVENAIYHGIEPATEPGLIEIHGHQEGGQIRLLLRNTLPSQPVAPAREGNRMALANTRARLQAYFSGGASLQLSRGAGHHRVDINLPVQR